MSYMNFHENFIGAVANIERLPIPQVKQISQQRVREWFSLHVDLLHAT